MDLILSFVYKKLEDFPNLDKELFVDVLALFEAANKYQMPLLQIHAEAVLARVEFNQV